MNINITKFFKNIVYYIREFFLTTIDFVLKPSILSLFSLILLLGAIAFINYQDFYANQDKIKNINNTQYDKRYSRVRQYELNEFLSKNKSDLNKYKELRDTLKVLKDEDELAKVNGEIIKLYLKDIKDVYSDKLKTAKLSIDYEDFLILEDIYKKAYENQESIKKMYYNTPDWNMKAYVLLDMKRFYGSVQSEIKEDFIINGRKNLDTSLYDCVVKIIGNGD